ncbi:MAG: DMT family transporter [Rhizobiaceae bacterium]|nr:DMT family transporter [Rhizobiaceae bacterium]
MTTPTPAGAASALIPLLVCTFAIFVLSAMDAAMKGVVIAIGVYNTVIWRSFLASFVAGSLWSARRPAWPRAAVLRLHVLRAAIVGVVLITFFWGLARLPLAEAIALSFVAPLIALVLAALLLGERIRKEAVIASLAGLGGVAVIMAGQFGQATFSQEALYGTVAVLLSTVFYAYNLILVRRQALVAGPVEITFFQNLTLTLMLGLAAPWLVVVPSSDIWLPIVGVTALSLSGQFLMSWAYARAEAQDLIPTEYTAFVWAIALGWFFFDESVAWTTIVGAALIIAGCLIAALAKPRLARPIEVASV